MRLLPHRLAPLPIALLISAVMVFALAACGSFEDSDDAPLRPPTAIGAAPAQQPPTPPPSTLPTATVVQPSVPPDTPSASELAPAQDPTAEAVQPGASGGEGRVAITIGDESLARYVIGEQLANRDLPNDAIGETPNVSGGIVFDADGKVVPELSTLVVDVSALRSDSNRRDNYLRGNTLQTSTYPEARLAVSEAIDLPWPLPESGQATFMLIGDFTVRDVTKVVKWDVTVEFGPEITGQAVAVFTFDYFEMSKPRLAFILSLDDEIRLELDFVASVEGTQ